MKTNTSEDRGEKTKVIISRPLFGMRRIPREKNAHIYLGKNGGEHGEGGAGDGYTMSGHMEQRTSLIGTTYALSSVQLRPLLGNDSCELCGHPSCTEPQCTTDKDISTKGVHVGPWFSDARMNGIIPPSNYRNSTHKMRYCTSLSSYSTIWSKKSAEN